MAAFQKNVFDATQETDPEEAKRIQQEYARQAKNMQKQFGGQQQLGTVAQGIGTPTGYETATAQSAADEFNRRKTAATNAFDLGSKVDTRRSQLADELDSALRKRTLATDKYSTKQEQDDRENKLTLQGIGEDARQKMQTLDFSMYKSQTDRNMAMQELNDKGDLENYMQKAASENALKQQDIDNYYAMLEAGLRAEYEAGMKNNDWDFQSFLAKADRDAKNSAGIISGLVTASSAILTKVKGA